MLPYQSVSLTKTTNSAAHRTRTGVAGANTVVKMGPKKTITLGLGRPSSSPLRNPTLGEPPPPAAGTGHRSAAGVPVDQPIKKRNRPPPILGKRTNTLNQAK